VIVEVADVLVTPPRVTDHETPGGRPLSTNVTVKPDERVNWIAMLWGAAAMLPEPELGVATNPTTAFTV
jgi:hypothetical protein